MAEGRDEGKFESRLANVLDSIDEIRNCTIFSHREESMLDDALM